MLPFGTVTQPDPLSVDDALDRLVNQFADAMAFFRELIQNALDAGSEEVEVDFEYDDGKLVIHVDDWGAGMNREIIDTRLTRLFSSSKDGDRTKIGKFGIGFVSVFAIEPDAVCIDTSREGEHWRILFDDQRRFTLIRRDEPVEGTKIRIFKSMTRSEYREFCERAQHVARYWCKHVDGEIRVAGELINEPFDLPDAPVRVSAGDPGNEQQIVVGHRRDGASFSGLYNRGLTLIEGALLPGVAFKASSARLEHTLTRDDVIREAGFDRLLDDVGALIANELADAVVDRLDGAIRTLEADRSPTGDALDELVYLWRAARYHAGHEQLGRAGAKAVFASPSGGAIELAAVRRPAGDRVVVAGARSPLTDALEADGGLVVWIPDEAAPAGAAASVATDLLAALSPVEPTPVTAFGRPTELRDDDERARGRALAGAVERLLTSWRAKVRRVRLGHFDYPESAIAQRVAMTQGEFGEITPLSQADEVGKGLLGSKRTVVLNVDHPTVRQLAALAPDEPELAAYLAVKAFFLGRRLDADSDVELAGLTLEARASRTGDAR